MFSVMFRTSRVLGVLGVLGGLMSGGQAALAQPGAVPEPAANAKTRRGMTFEANAGVGILSFSPEGEMTNRELALGGLNVGIGGWLTPRAALTLRIAGVTHSETGGSLTGGFVGGAVQIWPSDKVWLGVGMGLGFAALELEDAPDPDPMTGLGLDLRLGYTPFMLGDHSLNVSVEVTPAFLEGGTLTGVGFLVGYQYL